MKNYLSKIYYEKGIRQIHAFLKLLPKYFRYRQQTPETKFIIFAQGRTGSTLLVNLLNCSPDIYCDGEVFSTEMPFNIPFKKQYLKIRSQAHNTKAYGCRIKIYDLYKEQKLSTEDSISFINQMGKDGWKIIHLTRENKLKQCLSSLVAEERNVYHSKDSSKLSKVRIKTDELLFRIEWLLRFDEQEKKALKDLNYFKINYERDLISEDRHQEILNSLCTFLKVRTGPVNISIKKTSSIDYSNYISNHESVLNIISTSKFSRYLD